MSNLLNYDGQDQNGKNSYKTTSAKSDPLMNQVSPQWLGSIFENHWEMTTAWNCHCNVSEVFHEII